MNCPDRRYAVVDRTGKPLGFQCAAKNPSSAAKKAFYVALRKPPSERVVKIRRAPETETPTVPREDDVRARVAELCGERDDNTFTERYLRAASMCAEQTAVVHVVDVKKPRIWSYRVYRSPRWPFNMHHVTKGIYTSTFAKRL